MDKFYTLVEILFLIIVILQTTKSSEEVVEENDFSSEAVAEGKCPKNPGVFMQTNFTWVVQPRVLYIPMASEHYYRSFAETFLNRPAQSEDELNSMNLRLDVVYSRLANLGYDQHFIQLCLPHHGYGRLNCTFISGSKGVNPKSLENTIDTIVWTDNESAILFVKCINGRRRNWKLASLSPEILPEVEEKVVGLVEKMGFNKSYISRRI